MNETSHVRVAINGYGVIGKRAADAVAAQSDMALAGVADISADWRIAVAGRATLYSLPHQPAKGP